MSVDAIENRLSSVERDLAAVKAELARLSQIVDMAHTDWLDRIEGSMAEFPEFDEVTRLGWEFRKAYRPPQDNLTY